MANDIVKEILLKFKSDSKELTRDMDKLQAGLKGLEKGLGSGGGANKLFKSFKEFGDSANKVGMKLDKDFTRIQKTLQGIATRDLDQLGRKVEQMASKAERRLKKLQELEQGGAPESKLRRARTLAGGTDQRLIGMMDQFTRNSATLTGGGGRGAGGIGGMLGPLGSFLSAGAIANLPSAIAGFAQDRSRAGLINPAVANETAIQQRLAMYRGDLSMGVLARKGVAQRAQEYADRQSIFGRVKDYGTLGLGAGMVVGGALLSASGIGAVAGVPAATLGMGLMGAGGLAALRGGTGVTDRLFNNKTEAEKSRSYQEAVDAEKSRLIDDDLYQSFFQRAPERAAFRRRTGISEDVMANSQQAAMRFMVSPEEQMQIAGNLRSAVGSTAGNRLSVGVARQAMLQGMDVGTATQLMGTMATSGKGGTKQAEKNMEEMFTRAVSAGFLDTGIREDLIKMATTVASSSNSRLDPAMVLDRLLAFMPKAGFGEDQNMRELQGAGAAKGFQEERFAGTNPLDDAIKKQSSIKALRKAGVPVNMTNIELMSSLTTDELAQGSSRTEMLGLSDGMRKDILRERTSAIEGVNPDEARAMNDIRATVKSGKEVSAKQQYLRGAAAVSAQKGEAGLRGMTDEAIRAVGRGIISREFEGQNVQIEGGFADRERSQGLVDDYKKQRADEAIDSAVDIQAKASMEGRAKEEADISNQMTPGVTRQVSRAQRDANKSIEKAGDEADPSKSASAAVKSMESFSSALDQLTRQINRINSGRGASAGRPGP